MNCLINEQGNQRKFFHTRGFKSLLIIIALIFTTLSNSTAVGVSAETTGSQIKVTINYLEEIAVLTPGTGSSTKFYMSTDKMKTWEMVETTVDISTLLLAKDNIIYFKGNKDTNPVSTTILAEDSTLKVTYQITAGAGKITFPSGLPVQYRKGANGAWKTAVNSSGVSIFNNAGSTSIFEVRGATLYFRTAATEAKRAGKIITVKISKRPSAPSVKLDGSKLSITGLKLQETQYRTGDSNEWKLFQSSDSKAKSIDLQTLFNLSATQNTPIPAGTAEFRTLGTDKKLTSAIKVIGVPLQPTVPDTISVSGSAIKITDTDIKRAYEYTRVDKNSVLNLSTAKWTSVSSKNTVIVPKASIGDKLYIRLKSRTDSTSKQLIPASTYKEFTISSITTK
jgi:hypothetical protein